MEGQLGTGNSTIAGYGTTCLLSLPSVIFGLQMKICLLFSFSFFFFFLSLLQHTFGCRILHDGFRNYTELKPQVSEENVKWKN